MFAGEESHLVQPKSYKVYAGESVKFFCPKGSQILWFHESSHRHPVSHPINAGSTLSINSVSIRDSGNYFCYGHDFDTNRFFISESKLKVLGISLILLLIFIVAFY